MTKSQLIVAAIDPDLLSRVDTVAKLQRTTRSAFIRHAILLYLAQLGFATEDELKVLGM